MYVRKKLKELMPVLFCFIKNFGLNSAFNKFGRVPTLYDKVYPDPGGEV